MAAEVRADFSSMEFSNLYAIAPAFGTVTRTLFYGWATFTYEDGSVVPAAASKGGRSAIARALTEGPVYACLDKADAQTQASMRISQPNFFLPLDRSGIDAFTQRFPVTLRLEGTVRGTGGLRITDDSCATSVPGLYAAGDAATRELICGGFTGGGSHNAAWAMSSGYWAGGGATDYVLHWGPHTKRSYARAGTVALQNGNPPAADPASIAKAVQLATRCRHPHRPWRQSRGLLPCTGAPAGHRLAGSVEQAVSPSDFREACFLAAEFDLRLHTIVGDQLHEIIPVLEAVNERYPIGSRRWVIEHIGRARDQDIQALKRLGVYVTTIPTYYLWKGGDKYLAEPEDGNRIVPHRTILDTGIPLAIATDNIPYDPFFTLWTTCNREERTTGQVIGPDQRLDAGTALQLFTTAGAALTFDEGWKGKLKPDFAADIAVLSDDPTSIPPAQLKELDCRLTMVGGRIVHDTDVTT